MRRKQGCIVAFVVAFIVFTCIGTVSASEGYYWSKNGYLYTGQAATYEIQVDCGAQLVLTGPFGAKFDLYAMRSPIGSWPSENYIMSHYDKSEKTYNQVKYLNLNQGSWYVVVYASSGFGSFQLDASNTCYKPVPPSPQPCQGYPDCSGTNCVQVAKSVRTGYLNAGETKTYIYQITGDRNYIEWILTGPCGDEIIPMSMMSANEVSTIRAGYCGPDFSLYIYKDCDPRYQYCQATKADISTGSNKYVGITYPTTGSRYYAQIYDRSGSGSYTLTARSYRCQDDIIVMMSQKPEMIAMMSTASDVQPPIEVFGP